LANADICNQRIRRIQNVGKWKACTADRLNYTLIETAKLNSVDELSPWRFAQTYWAGRLSDAHPSPALRIARHQSPTHLISPRTLRQYRAEAMNRWDAVTAAA
jgi:hypothetical protein